MKVIVIGLCGVVGALLRYGLGLWLNPEVSSGFPLGTLVANIIGCFMLGWLKIKMKNFNPILKVGIGSGLIGSFTTFSTFSVETVNLLQQGYFITAILYITLSLILGFLFALLGFSYGNLTTGSDRG